jgi:hypothetical protein
MSRNYSNLLNTFVENSLKLPDSILDALENSEPLPHPQSAMPLVKTNRAIVYYFKTADTVKLSDEILDALDDDTYVPLLEEEPPFDEEDTGKSPSTK